MALWVELLLTFTKIGCFTFGGGYAMIGIIQREVVDRKRWIEQKEFLNLLTLAQSAPGPISLNTAVFVGYKVDGYRGAIASIIGTVIPSFVIILLIAMFFRSIRDNAAVEAALKGIRPAVVALIIAPMLNLSKGLNGKQIAAVIISTILLWKFGLSPVWLIIIGGVVGILYMCSINRFYKRGGQR